MRPSSSVLPRFGLVKGVLVGMFVLTALSQARVQLFSRTSILETAKDTHRFTQTRLETAKRGSIFSSDGKPLAIDDDRYILNVTFSDVPQSDAFFVDLAAASGLSATDFSQGAVRQPGRTKVWREHLTSVQAAAVRSVKSRWRAGGISLNPTGERAYPLGEAASGMVGRVREGTPEGGMESGFNAMLRGKDGKTVGLRDRTGAFLPMRIDAASVARQDGFPVVTTIDSVLQQEAAAALKSAVVANKATQGVAIVGDPATGDILAMANWPTFDPSGASGATLGTKSADFNPNYMGVLEPGSMFKPLTLALAMDLGLVHDGDPYYCKGEKLVWADRSIRCDLHGGTRSHGSITPQLAIAKSCNCAAATWAQSVGRDRFIEYLESLGLLEKQGLNLPGERAGEFYRDEYAKGLQLALLGFGQSISATPVGLLSAFGMLANDGVRMVPRLVKKIGGSEQESRSAGAMIRPETARQMMRYMETVVQTDAGTGKSLRIPGYRLAGKTGTAERRGKGTGYVASFIGFVPAEAPRAVILVMVDNPKAGNYYGGVVAGPVFRELASAVIRRYGIPPSVNATNQEGPAALPQRVPPSQ